MQSQKNIIEENQRKESLKRSNEVDHILKFKQFDGPYSTIETM